MVTGGRKTRFFRRRPKNDHFSHPQKCVVFLSEVKFPTTFFLVRNLILWSGNLDPLSADHLGNGNFADPILGSCHFFVSVAFFDLFSELVSTEIVTKNDFRRKFPKRVSKCNRLM